MMAQMKSWFLLAKKHPKISFGIVAVILFFYFIF